MLIHRSHVLESVCCVFDLFKPSLMFGHHSSNGHPWLIGEKRPISRTALYADKTFPVLASRIIIGNYNRISWQTLCNRFITIFCLNQTSYPLVVLLFALSCPVPLPSLYWLVTWGYWAFAFSCVNRKPTLVHIRHPDWSSLKLTTTSHHSV